MIFDHYHINHKLNIKPTTFEITNLPLTMSRFHQTVLPLEKMLKIWVKLNVVFAIVSFVETFVEMSVIQ